MIKIDTGTNELLCEIDQRVATITLNKPDKRNALGDILTPALRETLLRLDSDDRVGCVLITGAGEAFCSGGDVSGMSGGSGAVRTKAERIQDLSEKQITLTMRIYELSKVTIAALPGPAAGAGLSIALACYLRVASENAFLMTAFSNIGLSGDYGGSWFLPRLIGLSKAKEMYYTSERVGAKEAFDFGLVNKVFSKETFRDDAFAYACKIANGPTNTLSMMKENLNRSDELSLEQSLRLEARHLIECGSGDEAKEAISAFIEKRKPIFH
jgi:enoyl-CoA hydratase/carnithine racemase